MKTCGFSGKSICLFVALGVTTLAGTALCEEMWLLDLAKKEFPDITKSEEKLFLAVGNVRLADFTDPNNKEANDPNSADKWGPERILKAERIQWAWSKLRVQSMQIRGAKIEGKLSLAYKKPGSLLAIVQCAVSEGIVLDNAQFLLLMLEATHCGYISAPSIVIDGGADLTGVSVTKGGINLTDAKIGTNLFMDGAHIENRTGYAFACDRLEVGGNLSMGGGFMAIGEVSLSGAKVGNQLNCRGASFMNEGGIAVRAQGIKVESNVTLGDVTPGKGFEAKGEVRLSNGQIRGDLACPCARFTNAGKQAINAAHLKVEGSISLIYADVAGQVDLDGCEVGRDVSFEGFKADGKVSLVDAQIEGFLTWTRIRSPQTVTFDLRLAKVGTLRDDQNSWPRKGQLRLDGFVYGHIYDDAPIDPERRLEWLHRQPRDRYRPQPYEQLANVLRASGHDEEARQILIAKKKEWMQLTLSMPFTTRVWGRLLGWLMDYGYHPLKVSYMLLLIVIGWPLFLIAKLIGWISPCQAWAYRVRSVHSDRNLAHNYPRFYSLLYSIDVFIPLGKLHQMSYWLPKRTEFNAKRAAQIASKRVFSFLVRVLSLLLFLWPVQRKRLDLKVKCVSRAVEWVFYFLMLVWALIKMLLYIVLWVWIVFEMVAGWVTLSMLIAGLTLLLRI
jgi:hypothetical protein